MDETNAQARAGVARRTVMLESDVNTFRDIAEASRRYPWLVRGQVFAGDLRNLVASATMFVGQIVKLAGRPTPPPGLTLDQMLDLASSRNGTDDLVRPGLERGLRLMAGLPEHPTVADIAKLPRDGVEMLLLTDDAKDADYLRGLAVRLNGIPAEHGARAADADRLLSIADRLGPGR